MRLNQLFSMLLLAIVGGAISVYAQTTVTVGSQVTAESDLVSERAYVIQSTLSGAPYVEDKGTSYYAPTSANSATTATTYILTSTTTDGVKTWKIKNVHTGKYWGAPTGSGNSATEYQGFVPSDESSAGDWTLTFSNGNVTPKVGTYGINRYSSTLVAHTDATTIKIYEVSANALNLTFSRTDQTVTVSATDDSGNAIPGVTASLVNKSFTSFMTGSATALSRSENSVLAPAQNSGYGNAANSEITYTFKVEGLSTAFSFNAADVDVYAMNTDGAAQGNTGNTVRYFQFAVATGSTEAGVATAVEKTTDTDICTVSDQNGGLYHSVQTMTSSEALNTTAPLYIKVTLKKTSNQGCYAGIGSVKLYTEAFTASKVYTINNTNAYRGALTYDPSKSTKWVWSSGKSGATAFNASSANCQWILYPTAIEGQYYLYNVGAQKFAVPTIGGTYSNGNGVCWKFSDDAAAVAMTLQSDGTYKLYAVYGNRYLSVSNSYNGPIINYNDDGAKFTITKVADASEEVTTQLTTAINRLVSNRTKLTATSDFTSEGGWYVIKVNAGDWIGHSIFTSENEKIYSDTSYPIDFYGYGHEDASIASGQRLFRIASVTGGYTWQMPNGKYLYNPEQKFPLSTSDAVTIGIDKTEAGFSLYHKSTGTNQYTRYATPYNLNNTYFVGETSTATYCYDIYPVDLADAGLTAWQVLSTTVSDETQIQCSRSDVSGLASVYKNGYFFLPTDVTPTASDFSVPNTQYTTEVVVDATAKTITVTLTNEIASVEALTTGWYQVKCKTGDYAGCYVYNLEQEIVHNNLNYPIGIQSSVADIDKDDATFFIRFEQTGSNHYMKMPNGHYISRDKPVSLTSYSTMTLKYYNGFYFNYGSIYFAPMTLQGKPALGESSTASAIRYGISPVDVDALGLEVWSVAIENGALSSTLPANNTSVTCLRSDVKGLNKVYAGGYFFFPAGVELAASDFDALGLQGVSIDMANKTITATINPSVAISEEQVTVSQGYQVTGRGNDKALLLRATLSPFRDMTGVTLDVALDKTTADNISALKLYEASSSSVEFMAMTDLTEVASTTNIASDITLTMGSVSSGAHYYWLCATVKNDATLGAILDAAVTGVSYTCNGEDKSLDLTDAGNPSARGLMVFDKEQMLFVPTTHSSNSYRIPAIITANDGSIIVAADKRYNSASDLGNHKIDVAARRSTDGGATWSKPFFLAEGDGTSEAAYGYGDPAFVKTASGKLICLMAAGSKGFGNGLNHVAMVTSEDNGASWSNVVDITSRDGKWTNNSEETDFFVTSGKGLCTSDGVLMFLIDANRSNETNYVLYSTDEGESWYIDNTKVCTGGNEAKLEQTADGTLIASIRTNGNRAFNRGTYVKNDDGTVTFTWGAANADLTYSNALKTGNGNNQDIFCYRRNDDGTADILLHTMTAGNHANLKLFMSIDQGASWSEVAQIQPEGARYAVMSKLKDGGLAIAFEDFALNTGWNYPISFITITDEQILSWYAEMNEVQVAFHIYDTEGNLIYAPAPASVYGITTSIPTEMQRAFCTYTMYSDAAMTQPIAKIGTNTDVYVRCEYNGPVTFSTEDAPHCFFIHSREQNDANDYYFYADGETFKRESVSTLMDIYGKDAYKWAFIGNPYGTKIVNKATGKPLAAAANSGTNGSTLNIAVNSTNTYNDFLIYAYGGVLTAAAGVTNAFTIVLKGSQYAFVDYQARLLYYSSGVSLNANLALTGWRSNDMMVVDAEQFPVTLNRVGTSSYATLYLPFDVKTDEGTKAYVIKEVAGGQAKMTELTDGEIAARTAVVLVNEDGESAATFSVAENLTQQVSESDNLLKGTLTAIDLDLGDETPYYSMGRKQDGEGNYQIGFYKFDNNGTTTITLGANKAYLDTTTPAGLSVKGFTLSFGEEDGIELVNDQRVNGQSSNGKYFDLSGRPIANSQLPKGIYIVGGRKVVVK